MKILLICNYKPGVGGISGQVELLQKHLRAEGHSADIFSTKTSVIRRLLLPLSLRRQAQHYDVLHVHCCSGWGFLPAVVGVSVAKKLGKRVVCTYHGGGGERFFARHTRLVRHWLNRTDTNIVLSGFLGKVFDKYGLPYTVIPNIIELGTDAYRRREALLPRFICTRAHEPLYNVPCILRAFQKVKSEVSDATLTLVGDGSQHEALLQMTTDGVTFTGRVDNSEIYRYLDEADILLSAPRVDNMPVSLLEAMNAGLLVISSNVGGVPYMVKDNSTGLLFESDNDKELADKMLWALQNDTMAAAIADRGHNAAGAYLWNKIKNDIYTVYGITA